jgi:glutamine synthetase
MSAKSTAFISNIDEYGLRKFKGTEAAKYLTKQGLSADTLKDFSWTRSEETADKVAAAVLEWAKTHGATMFTHAFQPLGSGGTRLGQTAQVHNSMFNFKRDGTIGWTFDGDKLLHGESDVSSYMTGGMRATHTAGGYTQLDPSCDIYIRDDTVFIPTVFVSWLGEAIDEKTPLLRSMKAVSTWGTKLMGLLGWKVNGIQPNIGLEQEFFLIPRSAYYKRLDLQMSGRTIMGRTPPRGQELCDHYMGPLNQVALACMQEIQHEAFKMGIPLNTRHREVAPNQYECAPYFGITSNQIEENLMVMQLLEEIPAKHGLVGLLQEKPFMGINGSGKHNNFSLGTPEGVNLFNGPQVTKESGNADLFPIVMAAVIRAVDMHGDLLRMSIASPGNDFRLGACEAPPAILSTYLGDALTGFLDEFRKGKTGQTYEPLKKKVDLGIDVAPFEVPAEDRNRTSPFPYGGHRFEFRAAGSSQNVSMINTVLNSIIAESFKDFCEQIEAGAKPADVAAKALDEHWKVIFNGNGYSEEWPVEAGKRGLWRIDSGVEAMSRISAADNLAVWESLGVMSRKEAEARAEVMYEHYAGVVEIEAKCMIDMITMNVVPDCKKACQVGGASLSSGVISNLEAAVPKLEASLSKMTGAGSELEKAKLARVLRLETMEEVRVLCDEAEGLVPEGSWSLGTYKELLFLDSQQSSYIAGGGGK